MLVLGYKTILNQYLLVGPDRHYSGEAPCVCPCEASKESTFPMSSEYSFLLVLFNRCRVTIKYIF